MNLKNISLPFQGFVQATVQVFYVFIVVAIMSFIGDKLPQEDTILSSMSAILMFVVSAVVSTGIVLGRSAWLYVQKNQVSAYKLVGYTVVWMIVYFIIFVFILINY